MRRSAIMLREHPLARKKLAIRDQPSAPLVGYHPRSTTGGMCSRVRTERRHSQRNRPGDDSDVIKAYVAEGLGIGIVPAAILDRRLDVHLHSVDVTALFPRASTNIMIREAALDAEHAHVEIVDRLG